MSVLVVGISHRSAPVPVLERAALDAEGSAGLLADALGADEVSEAVVLATCNRVEVYAEVGLFHPSVAAVTEAVAKHTSLTMEELAPHLYVHYGDRAVQHLFSVAAGLDSMVVGESQILGQVRTALREAQEAAAVRRDLGTLVQRALHVGKRAHTETAIDRAGQSLVSVALDRAAAVVGGLEGRRAMVVGAGAMSALAAASLRRSGVDALVVANRTRDRGERLADLHGGRWVPLADLERELADADVVVSCTGALGHVVGADVVARALANRTGGPLALVDLALPRDVEPAVADLPGVEVVDLETIAGHADELQRAEDVEAVRRIVADEVLTYAGERRSASVAPTVVALRSMADTVVATELARLAGRLPGLDDHARDEIELSVRRVVDKVLHAPTVRVKQLAGEPAAAGYAEALRELFDLDPRVVEKLSEPEIAEDPR